MKFGVFWLNIAKKMNFICDMGTVPFFFKKMRKETNFSNDGAEILREV